MLTVSPTDRVFILAGAGVSAESGIPTFRGVGGLWRSYRIEEVASPEAWHRDPRLVWEFYSMRRRVASAAKPNPAHFALAKLEDALQDRLFVCTQNVDNLHEQAGSRNVVHMHGELFKNRCDTCSHPPFDDTNLQDRLFVCTQNVDNLHEQAGSRNVVHMHGELFKNRCDTCSHPPFDDTNLYDPPAEIPRCGCGGRIRPHICWFGEVPFELDRIYRALD